MFDKNSAAAGGAQDFAGTIQGIVAGHEKNELFTKLHGGEPYAAELNALIDCVNEELEYQRFRLRTVNEAVKSGMWYMKINPDFSIAYAIWSDEFRRMIGFRGESDFPNTIESWSSRLHPDDVEGTFSSFNACIRDLSGRTMYNVDYRLKIHDGSYRWYHASGNVVRDKNGHPEEIIGVFVDIDAEKKKQEEIEQNTQRKEKFYGELETMLSSLYGAIDAITTSVSQTTERTVEITNVQEEITQAADRLLAWRGDSAPTPRPPASTPASDAGARGDNVQGPSQLTREDLRTMTPKQILEARDQGRLNHIMGVS